MTEMYDSISTTGNPMPPSGQPVAPVRLRVDVRAFVDISPVSGYGGTAPSLIALGKRVIAALVNE